LVACTGQSLAFGKSPCWPFGDTGKNKVISGVIQSFKVQGFVCSAFIFRYRRTKQLHVPTEMTAAIESN